MSYLKDLEWLDTATLLDDSPHQTIQKAFRGIENWKKLIKVSTEEKGMYRLNIPPYSKFK